MLYEKPAYDKLIQDVPKMKLITLATVVERLKVGGALARRSLRELEAKGLIKLVSGHSKQLIYTRPSHA